MPYGFFDHLALLIEIKATVSIIQEHINTGFFNLRLFGLEFLNVKGLSDLAGNLGYSSVGHSYVSPYTKN